MATGEKEARLDFRVEQGVKQMIERAAYLMGQSVSAFSVSTLASAAHDVIEKYERARLNDKDRDRFLAILDEDEEPTEVMLAAVRDYKRLVAK